MTAPVPSPDDGRPLWRNRDFMLLWSGQVVPTEGMRITSPTRCWCSR
ncbi:hypothetical protein [Streptomyces sp. TRM68367]|nr:hypothetical protein [Streptomyces sp. TRM68367]MBC9725452.1 hypothetical protein [Streptomyces sp. TRM68367]